MKILFNRSMLILSLLATMVTPAISNASQAGNTVSDTVITSKIKSGLAANNVTHALNISVNTNNGHVQLSGAANSDTEAATAVQIAESTKNVIDVDASNLSVTGSDQPLTDTYITAKVKGIFIKNNLMSDKPNVPITRIKVETQQGVVYLSGTVKRPSQIKQAVRLAKSIDGVTNVVQTLRIG
jgi:hyperosmotically inducible protein